MNQTEFIELNPMDVIRVLREKIAIIVLAAVLGAGVLGAYSFFIADPVYESTAKIYVLTQSTSLTSFADIQISSSLAKDYEKMITSRPVVKQVKDNLGLDYSYDSIANGRVSIANPEDTRVLEITCKSTDPKEAAMMANEFATVSKRQIAQIMETDEPTIFEKAVVSKSPVSPNKKKNILLGLILGALISALILVLVDFLNNYIKTEEDVERYLKLNILASVPFEEYQSAADTKGGRK